MKPDKKNILPGAALAALIAAILVYCIMLNVEKNVLREYEKGIVLIAAKEMERGIVLTEHNVDTYLMEKEVDKGIIPEKALTDKKLVYQQIICQKVDKGAVLTEAMVTNGKQLEDEMYEPVVAGFKAEDLYQVVSGVLRSGDKIHIYTVDRDTGITYLVWDDIWVKEVFDNSGTIVSGDDRITAVQRVNILMEKEDVEQFYSELEAGSLRVVKALDE